MIGTGIKPDDGPLLPKGEATVFHTANDLAGILLGYDINLIDAAVISAAISCAQTFAIFWDVSLQRGISIAECDVSKEYFSNRKEDVLWAEFPGKDKEDFERARQELGDKEALVRYASHIFDPCVDRTLGRVYRALDAGARTVLICSHEPYCALITDELTQRPHELLGYGEGRIVSFEYPRGT